MAPQFRVKQSTDVRVISVRWSGPHRDSRIRSEFEQLARWAAAHKLRVGKWIFLEPGHRKWEVALEVHGRAKTSGKIRSRTLPGGTVLSITYNPDRTDLDALWKVAMERIRRLRESGRVRRSGTYREVYSGNPWKEAKAWDRIESQITLHRRKR